MTSTEVTHLSSGSFETYAYVETHFLIRYIPRGDSNEVFYSCFLFLPTLIFVPVKIITCFQVLFNLNHFKLNLKYFSNSIEILRFYQLGKILNIAASPHVCFFFFKMCTIYYLYILLVFVYVFHQTNIFIYVYYRFRTSIVLLVFKNNV